jgi:hypothetical protein
MQTIYVQQDDLLRLFASVSRSLGPVLPLDQRVCSVFDLELVGIEVE